VSPVTSERYYDAVKSDSTTVEGSELEDSYRLFMVPGMHHCRDGDGAWHFGLPTQNDAGNRPLRFDTEHDIILRLVAWTEQGLQPDYHVAAAYGLLGGVTPGGDPATDIPTWFASYDHGTRFTRKLCPYPKTAQYNGGTTEGKNAYQSFDCA
jgi:feruloyl esterase